jgi:hypothetical protein
MATGILEASGSDAPPTVHRTVQQRHSSLGQFREHGIHGVDFDGELEAGSGVCPVPPWSSAKLNTAELSSSKWIGSPKTSR